LGFVAAALCITLICFRLKLSICSECWMREAVLLPSSIPMAAPRHRNAADGAQKVQCCSTAITRTLLLLVVEGTDGPHYQLIGDKTSDLGATTKKHGGTPVCPFHTIRRSKMVRLAASVWW
jgi:hypothetical protein